MRRVGASPVDLENYADAMIDPVVAARVAHHRLAAVVSDLSARRYHLLSPVPGVGAVAECDLLIDALAEFDSWLRQTAQAFRDADTSCVLHPSVGPAAWAVFEQGLIGLAWAAPWATALPVDTDIVLVVVSGSAGYAGQVTHGFRVERYADGTVEVIELGEVGAGYEVGAAIRAQLGLGETSVGLEVGATASVLATLGGEIRWRVPADEVTTLIAHRTLESSGVAGAVRVAAELLTLIPESIGAFGLSVDIPGASALVAAGQAALAVIDYRPPEAAERAIGVGVEAGLDEEVVAGVELASLQTVVDASYERVDYLGGWSADRVRASIEGEIDLTFLEHDGSVALEIERRVAPDGSHHSLAVTWTTTVDGRVVTEETIYDLTHPSAGRLGREAWAGLLDPNRLGAALATAAGASDIPGVVRHTSEYDATERNYGIDFDVALLADIGVTVEVQTVALDRRTP